MNEIFVTQTGAHLGTLPHPEYSGVTGAHAHDGKIFNQIHPSLRIMSAMATKPIRAEIPRGSVGPKILRCSHRLKSKRHWTF